MLSVIGDNQSRNTLPFIPSSRLLFFISRSNDKKALTGRFENGKRYYPLRLNEL
jgi:hypothetical protein